MQKNPRVKSYKIHFMGPETKFNIHVRPIQKKMVHHTDMWSESKMHKNLEKSSNVPKILAKMKNNFLKRIYVCMRKQTKQLDIFTTKPPTKQLHSALRQGQQILIFYLPVLTQMLKSACLKFFITQFWASLNCTFFGFYAIVSRDKMHLSIVYQISF